MKPDTFHTDYRRERALIAFANTVLGSLEADTDWSPDTLAGIAAVAYALELATSDDNGHFRCRPNYTAPFAQCLRDGGAHLATWQELGQQTVGELAAKVLKPGVTFDCAKPQGIVDFWAERGIDIRTTSVTAYPPDGGNFGGLIVPLTRELADTFEKRLQE